MEALALNSRYAFADNPIRVTASAEEFGGADILRFNISSVGGVILYSGNVTPPLNVDISDVVKAFAKQWKEIPAEDDSPVVLLENMNDRALRFSVEGFSSFVFTAVPGGVSKQNFQIYAEAGMDAFQARFLNYHGNFFLTARSPFARLEIKESELTPLYFISDPAIRKLDIIEKINGSRLSVSDLDVGLYALNLDAVRRWFFINNGILCNCFDVEVNNRKCVSVTIRESAISKKIIKVRFKNSFGVYELIELASTVDSTFSMSGGEEVEHQKFQMVTGDWEKSRNRIPVHSAIQAELGPVLKSELPFILNMVSSDDVEIIGWQDYPVKVTPTIEESSVPVDVDVPFYIKVTFKSVTEEFNALREINSVKSSEPGGKFSVEFDEKFL